MLAFRPIEIADVCLPFEAAEWLALGRLPEFEPSEYLNEARNNIYCLTEGYSFTSEAFKEGELNAYGVVVDYKDYIETYHNLAFKSFDDFFHSSIYPKYFPGPPSPDGYYDLLLVHSVEDAMRTHMERAELMVLLALVEGRLTAQGFEIPDGWTISGKGGWMRENDEDCDHANIEKLATVREIPATSWTNTQAIWNLGDGKTNLPGFIGAWIDVDQLLKTFPEPNLPSREIPSCRQFGETLIFDGKNDAHLRATSSRRGRPKKGNGAIEKAVHAEFKRRAAAGENPEKKEALIEECIDWVDQTFQEQIGRTTAQRLLKPVLEA